MAEKKTSPNETVHRKKHFKHSFGGRGRWEIRKKYENFKNILRLKIFYVILIKKRVYLFIFIGVPGVEIAAGCRLKLIRFIKEPADLKLKKEKKADSILH